MENHRLARRLVHVVFLVAAAPGCQVFTAYRPVEVLVQDIESKQPIPGATVHLSYPSTPRGDAPRESTETTRENGVAVVQIAPCSDLDILVEVQAPGHLSEYKNLPMEAARELGSGHWYQQADERPIHIVMELYADPSPTVELVLPAGYHGVVRVEMQSRNIVPSPPGQRCFRYNVSAAGDVQIVGPPLLRRVAAPDFRAVYADTGVSLSREARGSEVGLWWLHTEGSNLLFLVGSQYDYENYRGYESMEPATKQAMSGGGKGKGGGRGGRHGQQPPDGGSAGSGGS